MTIYTAIFGEYDNLKEPSVITKGWDYVCYTNNPNLTSNVWKIKFVNNTNLNNVKAARTIKTRFFNYVKDELSIWCDASMLINCDLNEFVKQYHKGDLTTMAHPSRNCVYFEGDACIRLRKDSETTVTKQLKSYHKEGMPVLYGMVQTGVIIRNNTPEVRNFCRQWSDEVLKHSHRDQLSFNYVQWKYNDLQPHLISSDILTKEFVLNKHL